MQTYLIQDDNTKFLKIGKSQDPVKRLSQLQTGSSSTLTLLGVLDGDCEKELHENFKRCRIRINHEWFYNNQAIINVFVA